MSWAEYQNNLVDVNFHVQKNLETFEKKSTDKIWSNKDQKIKIKKSRNRQSLLAPLNQKTLGLLGSKHNEDKFTFQFILNFKKYLAPLCCWVEVWNIMWPKYFWSHILLISDSQKLFDPIGGLKHNVTTIFLKLYLTFQFSKNIWPHCAFGWKS